MHRFYISSENISSGKITINDKLQIHHIRDVLRLKPEEWVSAFDEKGNSYKATIEQITQQAIILGVKDKMSAIHRKANLSVGCAIPKNVKMEDVVDKLTQLGVDAIIPMNTKRVIVKLDEKKRESRVSRWRRIALSASKQSSRSTITDITSVKDFREVLNDSECFDLKIIPTLAGERKSLKSIFSQGDYKNILVLIGPEGDFTDDEISLAKKRGFIPTTLGDLVLRVDTAAVAVSSFIRLYENG